MLIISRDTQPRIEKTNGFWYTPGKPATEEELSQGRIAGARGESLSRPYPLMLRLFSLFILGLSLVGAALVPNPLSPSTPPPQSTPRSIPQTDVYPLGAHFFLDREVEFWKMEQTLRMAREAGIGWGKVLFSWAGIEPRKGEFWDDRLKKSTWEKYDQILSLSEKYGIKVIARLEYPPDWSRKDNSFRTAPPDNLEDLGDFVYAVVDRYRGRIQYYQIWNEPNIWPHWGNHPVNPRQYVELLKVAYRRAKEADPNAIILSAPLAQTLEKGQQNLNEMDFLEAMYKAGAKDYFDILSANAYGFDRPPQDAPDPGVLNFARVQLVREVMVRNGDANKAVWLNEFGWNAAPEGFPPEKLRWKRVTEQQQADYTLEGIKIARGWEWMGVIGIWYFRQVGDILATESAEYYFRVVDVDFTPRLVYHALKTLSSSLRRAPPGLHQETSAALESRGSWRPLLRPEANAGGALLSSTPGDSITFTFQGSGIDLIYRQGPSSGGVYVRIDGANPPSLPRDEQGRAYLDLYSLSEAWQVRATLAKGLSPGLHTLELRVAEEKDVTIDAFEVAPGQPSFWRFYWYLGVILLGLAGLVGSFLLGRRG